MKRYILKEIRGNVKDKYMIDGGVILKNAKYPYIPDNIFELLGVDYFVFLDVYHNEKLKIKDTTMLKEIIEHTAEGVHLKNKRIILKPLKFSDKEIVEDLILNPNFELSSIQKGYFDDKSFLRGFPNQMLIAEKLFLESIPCRYIDFDKLNTIFPVKEDIKYKILGLPEFQISRNLGFSNIGDSIYLNITYDLDLERDFLNLQQHLERQVRRYFKDIEFNFSSLWNDCCFYSIKLDGVANVCKFLELYTKKSNLYESINYYGRYGYF